MQANVCLKWHSNVHVVKDLVTDQAYFSSLPGDNELYW
jgi:hypothetical protein